ncbi:LacI family DNA-binding transcriptional regulator [Saccharibacillus sp. JS10]|uniref:LacI family DNA-binding transcriptional regulator n=1 Tax=Saccharibacillus sp. JS10 TaxID=2950552 RepID=UPI00210D50A1|nr:LacI family DNA-binding transcriptional regulator [Saccharibacillus sp. JS10]MCQ4085645.1 LacI family transcriptional regulator [Saccharibacillus sp. JS10]
MNKRSSSPKRTTSQDVAKRAGVSRSVVSAVLNGTPGIGVSQQTRDKVLAAIQELDYHVDSRARGMKTGRSMTLAAFGDTSHPLFMRMLEGMQRASEQEGYHLLLSSPSRGPAGESREELLELYQQRRIDGIVTLDDTSYADTDWAAKVKNSGAAYVSVEGYAEDERVHSVHANYRESIQAALEYLWNPVSFTHTAPEYAEVFSLSHEGIVNWAEQQRRLGYEEWCSEKGLTPNISRHKQEEGKVDWHEWCQDRIAQQSAAPVLVNWSSAVPNLQRAAHSFGLRLGQDLLVMAADNTIQGDVLSVPTLSCVEIPYIEMGEAAVRQVLKQVREPEIAPSKVWLPAILKPGESA